MTCCTCVDGQYDCAVHPPTEEIIRNILDHLDEIHEAQERPYEVVLDEQERGGW